MCSVTFMKDKTALTSGFHTYSRPDSVRDITSGTIHEDNVCYLHGNPSLCSWDMVGNLETQP